jgi:hypothetical protein
MLAVAGGLVATGQVLLWSSRGAWPFHDTANIWLAGRHLLEGAEVYTGKVGGFLVFVYSPPIAVLAAPLSLLPLEVLCAGLFVAQVGAFRWICGSWRTAGLVAWLPIVPREFVTGNNDFLVAATIYASVLGLRGSGYAAALFSYVKFSPFLAVGRRWPEFVLGLLVLFAVSLPWIGLWPAWVYTMLSSVGVDGGTLVPRIPVVVALLLLRRPWSIAAAAAIATPALYFHSGVLLLPAARLGWDQWMGRDRSFHKVSTQSPSPDRDSQRTGGAE